MHQSRGYKDFSEFARKLLTQGKIVKVVVATDPSQIRGELSRIGSNINQIAHRVNAGEADSKQMLDQVLTEQKRLTSLFLKISNDYEKAIR
jgi:4-hydroxyphenylpyruvate dioxygenase-like putative hemolysin